MPNYVPGVGPFNPKLMIVGEAPGKEENEQKIPFVGPTGSIVNDLLKECGISRSEVWVTNVVKYQPPYNDFTKLGLIQVDLQEQIQKLWSEEIYPLRPNCILAIGDRALEALTDLSGILNYRGSILPAVDGAQKVVATIHPAALFPKKGEENKSLPWVYLKLIKSDFQRAVDESRTREINLPDRNITIASNSLDVYRFFREYEKCKKVSPDIESINCVPVSIAFAFNKHHSITIPLLSGIGSLKLTDMSRHEVAECWKLIQEALLEKELIGQNFKYDEYKLSLLGFKCGKVVSDVLLKTHTLFPELPVKSLAVQTSLWTREPYYKEEGKEPKIGRSFDVKKFFLYNGRDSCVTFEIDEEQETDLISMGETLHLPLHSFYYDYVMKKHKLYLKLENLGFRVDFNKKNELKYKYEGLQEFQHDKLVSKIGHEVNVKSYPQIFQLLYKEMGFREMKRDPTSEDTITALLGNHCKGKDGSLKKEILEGILEERRIRDQLSRQINFTPDYDQRCKTSYKISGTETARRSTNILKKPMRPKKIGLSFHTISTHGRLAKDIKSMFIPDDGCLFIKGDASQAEPRIVAVLSEDWELLQVMQAGIIDIHRRTAALIFGYTSNLVLHGECPIADKMEKDGPERYTGKTTRMAGLYDVQKRTFMMTFNTNAQKYEIPVSVSEWRAGQMLEIFHAASPKVKAIFHRDTQNAIKNTRLLVNPFGRPRIFNARMEDDIFKEAYAYIPQSTVADLVDNAAIKIDEELGEHSCFVSENHDALTMQAPVDDWERYARLLKKHMQFPIDFSTYCTLKRDYILTIPCDIEVGERNFADMKKVKIALEEAVI